MERSQSPATAEPPFQEIPPPAPPGAWPLSPPLTLPVAEERLVVGKRQVETGRVRIVKKVATRRETLAGSGWEENLRIERVPVNRPVDAPPPVRQEGDTLVIPVLEERLVVEKRLFLREELRIAKHRTARAHPLETTLRREEVTVERLPPVSEETDGD